jgi:hypothetical protein
MITDTAGHHLDRKETAAAVMLWFESRGAVFTIEPEARTVTCDLTSVDHQPLTAAEVEDLVVDLFDGIREILLARGLTTVH